MEATDIAEAVRAMDDPLMRERAARLGEAIRAEDGVAAAIGFIERRMQGRA
jgi:sterol 3beta-glucosyltransferase